jgi:hypothetical protein
MCECTDRHRYSVLPPPLIDTLTRGVVGGVGLGAAAVKAVTAMAKRPDTRAAALTMLGKLTEVCAAKVRDSCDAGQVRELRAALDQVRPHLLAPIHSAQRQHTHTPCYAQCAYAHMSRHRHKPVHTLRLPWPVPTSSICWSAGSHMDGPVRWGAAAHTQVTEEALQYDVAYVLEHLLAAPAPASSSSSLSLSAAAAAAPVPTQPATAALSGAASALGAIGAGAAATAVGGAAVPALPEVTRLTPRPGFALGNGAVPLLLTVDQQRDLVHVATSAGTLTSWTITGAVWASIHTHTQLETEREREGEINTHTHS